MTGWTEENKEERKKREGNGVDFIKEKNANGELNSERRCRQGGGGGGEKNKE